MDSCLCWAHNIAKLGVNTPALFGEEELRFRPTATKSERPYGVMYVSLIWGTPPPPPPPVNTLTLDPTLILTPWPWWVSGCHVICYVITWWMAGGARPFQALSTVDATRHANCLIVATALYTLCALSDAQRNVTRKFRTCAICACRWSRWQSVKIFNICFKMIARCYRRRLQSVRRVDKWRKKFLLFCIIFQCFFGDEADEFVPRHLWWVHPMNIVHGHPGKGEFHAQVQELKSFPDRFLAYFWMPLEKYFKLVNQIRNSHHVAKQNTNFRKCIGVEEGVAVFLQYVTFLILRQSRNKSKEISIFANNVKFQKSWQ